MKAVCDVMHWPGPQLVWVAPLDRTDTPFGAHLVSKQLSVQSYPVQFLEVIKCSMPSPWSLVF